VSSKLGGGNGAVVCDLYDIGGTIRKGGGGELREYKKQL
jgi:hypothetical protein